MEGVECWSVDDGGLVADEHASAVVETVDYNGSGVSEADLEDGLFVF